MNKNISIKDNIINNEKIKEKGLYFYNLILIG